MEFNYARFTEEWAHIYKPMLHEYGSDASNKRFFICDSYMSMTDFMRQMDPDTSPCVIIESQQEGSINSGYDYPRYSFYFMVRATAMTEGYAAIQAKCDAKSIMLDYVNFVRVFKRSEDYATQLNALPLATGSYLAQLRTSVLGGDRCMENINIEDFAYESINEMYDGWYGINISLDDTSRINMCIDSSKY